MKKHLSILVLGLACAGTASAAIIDYTNISNLSDPIVGAQSVSTSGTAASFTTGSNSATMYAADLILDALGPVPNAVLGSGGGLTVGSDGVVGYAAYIYSDASGTPGSLLYTLSTLNNSSTNALLAFTAPANSTLAADTTYWLVVKAPSASVGDWAETTSSTVSSLQGWSLGSGGVTLPGNSVFSDTPLFAITVVPEPGTMALAGLGALSLMMFRRRL